MSCGLYCSAQFYNEKEGRYLQGDSYYCTCVDKQDTQKNEIYSVNFKVSSQKLPSCLQDLKDESLRLKEDNLIGNNDMFSANGAILSLAVLPNGYLAAGFDDQTIKVWDTQTGTHIITIKGHIQPVQMLNILNSSDLVSASFDGSVNVWNTKSWTLKRKYYTGQPICALTVFSNGYLAFSYDTKIKVFRINNDTEVKTLVTNYMTVKSLAVLRNNDLAGGAVGKIFIWNTKDWTLRKILKDPYENYIVSMVILKNGDLASGSFDGTISIWNVVEWKVRAILIGHALKINSMIVLDNGNLVTSSDDTTIITWDTNDMIMKKVIRNHSDSVNSLSILSDGRVISASSDRKIKIWTVGDFT